MVRFVAHRFLAAFTILSTIFNYLFRKYSSDYLPFTFVRLKLIDDEIDENTKVFLKYASTTRADISFILYLSEKRYIFIIVLQQLLIWQYA